MNWYKKANIPRTLYHGTSINNYNSIKEFGLLPQTGDFVTDAYSGEYEAAGVDFDPVEVTFATDKDELSKAVTAMKFAVSKMLGRNYHDVTSHELKAYGMLVILRGGEEYMEKRPVEEEGPWGDWQGETGNRYPTVEPGDYYSEEAQGPVEILVGNKMVEFLRKKGVWPINPASSVDINEVRKQLLTLAIHYHIKENPELRDKIIRQVTQNINNLNDEEVMREYRFYRYKDELV